MPLLLLQRVDKDALSKCVGTKNPARLAQSFGVIYPCCILITDAETHAPDMAVERVHRQDPLLMSHTVTPASPASGRDRRSWSWGTWTSLPAPVWGELVSSGPAFAYFSDPHFPQLQEGEGGPCF